MNFKNGFDLGHNLLLAAENQKIINKSGNTYYYNEEKLGVGIDKATEALNNYDESVIEEIYKKVAGEIVKERQSQKHAKKEAKIAKYLKKYLEVKDDEELKEHLAKKITNLGGKLPEV